VSGEDLDDALDGPDADQDHGREFLNGPQRAASIGD